MYYYGHDVPEDDVEVYPWFLLVKANEYEKASEAISLFEKRLTAEQKEKGQVRAAELHRLQEQQSAK